ncbi:MAG: hypothetical protein IIZ69_04860 [Pseudomonas sp.]|uniref:hypothetical protein n=1 Tax=Acidovorax sp. TaxID=1872122 RepID=UPI0027BAF69B|nr:hypothetical protein [Acidovorax sp.]MBQ1557500.1 hypothetical protein [Pseudomonas sp.]
MIENFSIENLPGASVLYGKLAAGAWLRIDANGIGWDDDFEALVGTNAHGQDYVWGALTLTSVELWRQRLVDAGSFGFCPDSDMDPLDVVALQLHSSNLNVTIPA